MEQLLATPERINALMEYSSVNGELPQREIVCAWLNKYGFTATGAAVFQLWFAKWPVTEPDGMWRSR